jgi:hypothetical protein
LSIHRLRVEDGTPIAIDVEKGNSREYKAEKASEIFTFYYNTT